MHEAILTCPFQRIVLNDYTLHHYNLGHHAYASQRDQSQC